MKIKHNLESIVRKKNRLLRTGIAVIGLAALVSCNNILGNNPDEQKDETIVSGFELKYGSPDGSSEANFNLYAGDEIDVFTNTTNPDVKGLQIYDIMNSRWVAVKENERFQFADGDWSNIRKDATGRFYIDVETEWQDTSSHIFAVRVRLDYGNNTYSNYDTLTINKNSRNSRIYFDGVQQSTLRDDFTHSMNPGKGKLTDLVAAGNYDKIIWKLTGNSPVEKTMKTGESFFEPYILTLEWTGYKDLIAEMYLNGRQVGRAGAYISSNNESPTIPERPGGNHIYANPGDAISFNIRATDPNEDSLEFILYNDPLQPISGANITPVGKYDATFSCSGLPAGEYRILILAKDAFDAESPGYGEFIVTVM